MAQRAVKRNRIVNTTLSEGEFDALTEIAESQGKSRGGILRDLVQREIRRQGGEPFTEEEIEEIELRERYRDARKVAEYLKSLVDELGG